MKYDGKGVRLEVGEGRCYGRDRGGVGKRGKDKVESWEKAGRWKGVGLGVRIGDGFGKEEGFGVGKCEEKE